MTFRKISAIHQVSLWCDIKYAAINDEGDVRDATIIKLTAALSLPQPMIIFAEATLNLLFPLSHKCLVVFFWKMNQCSTGVDDTEFRGATGEFSDVNASVSEALNIWGPEFFRFRWQLDQIADILSIVYAAEYHKGWHQIIALRRVVSEAEANGGLVNFAFFSELNEKVGHLVGALR